MDFDGQRICGVTDQMGAAQVCAFPRPPGGGPVRIGWYMTGVLPGWDELQQFEAIREAWSYWEAVCGIEAVYYESSSAAVSDLANKLQGLVMVTVASIDGASGVLADSFLPCGTIRIKQRYDAGERWINAAQPSNGIDLVRVACHELGHAIGLSHISSGNLLQPMYSTAIRKPQSGDIAEVVKRYGPRRAEPAPPPIPKPTPAPGGGMGGFLDLLKKIGPILDLLKDPRFLELIDLIVTLFGNKQGLTADDMDALAAQLTAKAQQMRAP